jgi:hypothetical protein
VDFYLGADVTGLAWEVPVMISHGRLRERRTLPTATAAWVCDSRGFSELKQHGRWTISPAEYADALALYAAEIGQLVWAAPQDWMCEPDMLANTGKTIAQHQALTVASVLELRAQTAVHIIPVLQGWQLRDYLTHVDQYAAAGIDLFAEPVVGLGSVCRRQASTEIRGLVGALEALGLHLHGFGVKTDGIDAYGPLLASADSFAWSYWGRRVGRCTHGSTKWEANCPRYALAWRQRVLNRIGHAQPALDLYGAAA